MEVNLLFLGNNINFVNHKLTRFREEQRLAEGDGSQVGIELSDRTQQTGRYYLSTK